MLPEVFDFIMSSVSCAMMQDRVLTFHDFFVVLMDSEMVMASVCMIFDLRSLHGL